MHAAFAGENKILSWTAASTPGIRAFRKGKILLMADNCATCCNRYSCPINKATTQFHERRLFKAALNGKRRGRRDEKEVNTITDAFRMLRFFEIINRPLNCLVCSSRRLEWVDCYCWIDHLTVYTAEQSNHIQPSKRSGWRWRKALNLAISQLVLRWWHWLFFSRSRAEFFRRLLNHLRRILVALLTKTQ